MEDEVLKRLPVEELDTMGVEDWLEQMALQGNFFNKIAVGWCYFKTGEPKKVRYRIDTGVKKAAKIEPDKKEDYEALGWHYIYTHRDKYHIFMADDPDTEELHTDPSVENMALKRLERTLWLDLIPFGILFVLQWFFPKARIEFMSVIKYPLLSFINIDLNVVIMYLLLLFLTAQTCCTLKKMHTLRKNLAKGKTIRFDVPPGKREKYKTGKLVF